MVVAFSLMQALLSISYQAMELTTFLMTAHLLLLRVLLPRLGVSLRLDLR
jgi:hypothetical protein